MTDHKTMAAEWADRYRNGYRPCPGCGHDEIFDGPDHKVVETGGEGNYWKTLECGRPGCRKRWTEFYALTHVRDDDFEEVHDIRLREPIETEMERFARCAYNTFLKHDPEKLRELGFDRLLEKARAIVEQLNKGSE